MNIQLINKIPSEDGYYLFRFNDKGGLHLVLIQTEIDGTRVLLPDNSKVAPIRLNSKHEEVFRYSYFSEKIEII